jgi:hypothetical protein
MPKHVVRHVLDWYFFKISFHYIAFLLTTFLATIQLTTTDDEASAASHATTKPMMSQ